MGGFGCPGGWKSGAKSRHTHFRNRHEPRIHTVRRDGTGRDQLPGMARADAFVRIKSGRDRTSDLPWVSTMAASARRAPPLAPIGPLADATTIRNHVLCRHAVKTSPQPAAVPGSWDLRGSRTWPGPIGRWHAIARTVPCNLRTIVAAIRRLPFRPRRKLSLPNRVTRQPRGVDDACALAGSHQWRRDLIPAG